MKSFQLRSTWTFVDVARAETLLLGDPEAAFSQMELFAYGDDDLADTDAEGAHLIGEHEADCRLSTINGKSLWDIETPPRIETIVSTRNDDQEV